MSKKEYDYQEYNRRWANKNEENKWNRRKMSYRSTARTFIRKYADEKDLLELQEMIENKLKEFE